MRFSVMQLSHNVVSIRGFARVNSRLFMCRCLLPVLNGPAYRVILCRVSVKATDQLS
jgi:hypothetical protein